MLVHPIVRLFAAPAPVQNVCHRVLCGGLLFTATALLLPRRIFVARFGLTHYSVVRQALDSSTKITAKVSLTSETNGLLLKCTGYQIHCVPGAGSVGVAIFKISSEG